jgi:aminopeptidase N
MSQNLARFAGPLVVLALAAPRAAPQDDGQGWRWESLDLDLWIEADVAEIHIEGRGTLVLDGKRSKGPTLELNGRVLELVRAEAQGASVELLPAPAKSAGDDAPLTRARFVFTEPRTHGAKIAVEFECDKKARSGQFDVNAHAALASWVETWYPVPAGDPARLSERLAAPGLTRFHLPDGWQSVSNGERLAASEETEAGVETWRVATPVARSFACAPFTSSTLDVDGREVGIHRLRGAKPPDVELAAIASILRTLEARYGPYPYPGYRVVEVPLGVGDFLGSSEQGFILVRPVAFDAPDGNLALFAHELAHGWWGNRVSSEGPGSILLSEGLAQFSAVVAIAAIEGEDGATAFLRFSRPGYVDEQCARGYFQNVRAGGDLALATLDGKGESHQLADAKGHWVFEMLRRRVGDERFFAVMRGLVQDFATTPLTLAEFRARFARAAPEAEVPRFFAEWLDRAGAPVLESEWSAEAGHVSVRVRQVQAGEPYHLPLEIALDSATGRSIRAVELGEREQRFELTSDVPVTGIALDPRHRILIWTEDYGPKPKP